MNEYKRFGLYSSLTQNDHKKISGPYILLDYLVVYQFIAQTETKMFWQRAENGQDHDTHFSYEQTNHAVAAELFEQFRCHCVVYLYMYVTWCWWNCEIS